jgi:isopenicillin-N epimerase
VPAAIDFQAEHEWPRVRAECRELLQEARRQVEELTGLPGICPDSPEWYAQMAAFPLAWVGARHRGEAPAVNEPSPVDASPLQRRLCDEYRVEAPIIEWNGRQLLRVSIQAYNTLEDVETLLLALGKLGLRGS